MQDCESSNSALRGRRVYGGWGFDVVGNSDSYRMLVRFSKVPAA